jgi:hypothetical protein
MRKRAALLLALVLLASCAGRPVPPQPRVLPAAGRTVYFPYLTEPVNKLGMAGCPSAAAMALFGGNWCYSWGPVMSCVAGVDCVPMIRDLPQMELNIASCSDALMGWNEPDICPEQGCVNISAAVQNWPVIEERAARLGVKTLVAPAPSQRRPAWLPEFRAAYHAAYGRYPRFDALAVHCYRNSAEMCIREVERYLAWAAAWGVGEVWVTEIFFSQEREQRAFMRWVDGEDRVTRVAPFVSRADCAGDQYWDCQHGSDPSLVTERDELTAYGRMWARPKSEGP